MWVGVVVGGGGCIWLGRFTGGGGLHSKDMKTDPMVWLDTASVDCPRPPPPCAPPWIAYFIRPTSFLAIHHRCPEAQLLQHPLDPFRDITQPLMHFLHLTMLFQAP